MPRQIQSRQSYPQHVHFTRVLQSGGDTVAAGVPFDAKLPPGADILGIHSNISTAFSGGTPVISIGRTGAATEIIATIAIGAGKLLSQAVAGFLDPTADYEARLFITGGSTAGVGEFTLMYATRG